jgi:hypothetical protein
MIIPAIISIPIAIPGTTMENVSNAHTPVPILVQKN